MKFKSKTEAYSFSILILSELCNPLEANPITSPEQALIEALIERFKIAMENHEQDLRVIIHDLDHAKRCQNPWVSSLINTLQHDLECCDFKQTPQEKFENPLARRAESELALALLFHPTAAMMHAVGRISMELVKFMKDQAINWQTEWGPAFQEKHHVISLGAFKEMPTFLEVQAILEKNDPAQLTEIMHLHFKFASNFTRIKPIANAPIRTPVGKLAELIASAYEGQSTYFYTTGITLEGRQGTDCRSYIVKKIYESDLFVAKGNRGRSPSLDFFEHFSDQMGLMLIHQHEEEKGLPTHDSEWIADCKNQAPNLESPYVHDLIENDAVYVSGPSGMTSILLGQMETMANFENETFKKNYLSAILAYIVGGGFHSIHEVIGPAQYILNLVPSYHVHPPQIGQLAKPPNYHVFLVQQALIDPEFKALREMAWQNYLRYFKADYCPRHIEELGLKMKCEKPAERDSDYAKFFKTSVELDIGEDARKNSVLSSHKYNQLPATSIQA